MLFFFYYYLVGPSPPGTHHLSPRAISVMRACVCIQLDGNKLSYTHTRTHRVPWRCCSVPRYRTRLGGRSSAHGPLMGLRYYIIMWRRRVDRLFRFITLFYRTPEPIKIDLFSHFGNHNAAYNIITSCSCIILLCVPI